MKVDDEEGGVSWQILDIPAGFVWKTFAVGRFFSGGSVSVSLGPKWEDGGRVWNVDELSSAHSGSILHSLFVNIVLTTHILIILSSCLISFQYH